MSFNPQRIVRSTPDFYADRIERDASARPIEAHGLSAAVDATSMLHSLMQHYL